MQDFPYLTSPTVADAIRLRLAFARLGGMKSGCARVQFGWRHADTAAHLPTAHRERLQEYELARSTYATLRAQA